MVVNHHKLFVIFLLVLVPLFIYLTWDLSSQLDSNIVCFPRDCDLEPKIQTNTTKKARFAKVTVMSGFEDIAYEQALDTHVQHAVRHGYPMYIARENAVDGIFNKIAYIQNILLNELYKPKDQRVEWLL